MKNVFKSLLLILSCAVIFAACEDKTFNANVLGVSSINVNGVKAFASLSNASSSRAGGSSESLLYAVDENNNISLPDITCDFEFGDEVTEEERQAIIKDMNATIRTESMRDFGSYVFIKNILSYTSSYIEQGGKAEITATVGFINSVVRKSDGKTLNLFGPRIYELDHVLLGNDILVDNISDSKGNTYMVYSDGFSSSSLVTLSEQSEKELSISSLRDNIPDIRMLVDANDNVYMSRCGEITKKISAENYEHIEGYYSAVSQVGKKIYAVSVENDSLNVYTILNGKRQLDATMTITDVLPFKESVYAGCVNGELVWYGGELLKYNIADKSIKIQQLDQTNQELIACNKSQIFNGVAYCAVCKDTYVELVAINLQNEENTVSKIDIPQGETIAKVSFSGSIPSDYLRLNIWLQNGELIQRDVHGVDEMPNFKGYEVHEVIPLKLS